MVHPSLDEDYPSLKEATCPGPGLKGGGRRPCTHSNLKVAEPENTKKKKEWSKKGREGGA